MCTNNTNTAKEKHQNQIYKFINELFFEIFKYNIMSYLTSSDYPDKLIIQIK